MQPQSSNLRRIIKINLLVLAPVTVLFIYALALQSDGDSGTEFIGIYIWPLLAVLLVWDFYYIAKSFKFKAILTNSGFNKPWLVPLILIGLILVMFAAMANL